MIDRILSAQEIRRIRADILEPIVRHGMQVLIERRTGGSDDLWSIWDNALESEQRYWQ